MTSKEAKGGTLNSVNFGAGTWHKSSLCITGTCVEILMTDLVVRMRDSKTIKDGMSIEGVPYHEVPSHCWPTFLAEVVGECRPGSNGHILATPLTNGDVLVTSSDPSTRLVFDAGEWLAFTQGVTKGEFGQIPQLAG